MSRRLALCVLGWLSFCGIGSTQTPKAPPARPDVPGGGEELFVATPLTQKDSFTPGVEGQVWRIDAAGNVTLAAADMGTTNGIDLSPDGKTLYVNESVQRNVWAFTVAADGSLSDKRLVKRFDDFGMDGMRCDVDGNLYVTR